MAERNLGMLVAAVAIFAAPFLTSSLEAQQVAGGRVRVLVPDFQPMGRENKNFGKDLAEELREAIGQLNTHAAVDEDDIKDALKRFKRKMEDLNCTLARQLAAQSNYGVVLCATYAASGTGIEVLDVKFVDAAGDGEEFLVASFMSSRGQEAQAAAHIVEEFALFVEQSRRAIICGEYARSQQWEQSLENCDIATAGLRHFDRTWAPRGRAPRHLDRTPTRLGV